MVTPYDRGGPKALSGGVISPKYPGESGPSAEGSAAALRTPATVSE